MKLTAAGHHQVIGRIPNRLALAGGWIDQPFVSRLNPRPPGSMVVVALEPTFRVMDRAGCASGTRAVAMKIVEGRLPNRPPEELVRELYDAENKGKAEPSGSQDMIGLVYPGINRLDYDFAANGGVFPSHIESLNHARVARWLERVLHVLPIEPRPDGYNPLGEKHLDPQWIARLGADGQGLLRRHSPDGCRGAGRVLERLHDMLGEDPAAHRAAPLSRWTSRRSCARTSGAIPAPCIPAAAAAICSSSPRSQCPALFKSPFAPRLDQRQPDKIVVTGGFDDIRSRQLRFLQEASRLGELTVLLWPDEAVQARTGKPPKFPLAERRYFLEAVRYVSRVIQLAGTGRS